MADEEVDAYREDDGPIQPSYYGVLSTVSSDEDVGSSNYYPIEDEVQVMVEAVMEAEDRLDVKRRKLWGSKRNKKNKNAMKNKIKNRKKRRGNFSEDFLLPQTKQELSVCSGQVMSSDSSCCTSSVDFSLVTEVDERNAATFIKRVSRVSVSSTEISILRYIVREVYGGNRLRNTISVGNEKKRQIVYDVMFSVPLKCELLILAGFFVCLDSFLSLLTIMPARILIMLSRVVDVRQFQRFDAADLSDFGCLVAMFLGVVCLQLADISMIYHIIRGQGVIKLYMVYNVLEMFDKLLQSFGEEVLQVLFSSAERLATCSSDNFLHVLLRFVIDQMIAAITLSTCIVAHNHALASLLISSNFAEIKSFVFRRVNKGNLHRLVCHDIKEMFHITAFLLFVLAQNMLEVEGSWFGTFLFNAFLVYMCECLVDTVKHAFLAKFNEIKPDAYSDFLEDLCKQVLNTKPEGRKTLNFIPLAPACVVIRVLTPIYATLVPHEPLSSRWFWIMFWLILSFLILSICKLVVGLALNYLATWYINYKHTISKQHVD
ncbi:Protein POLLEN DEFECTIVE IN GUIDANCE 1 [Zostera marina]|uniref:Protein POLLEN DEFECTIVE IN GUIDANCE 1 n=1 Tax=Zostera marina TaxID=29655 RepID=A0A0K9NSB0_ZOSMR|nr:Protein POLLEN DEFECTIVE IN GUIDANCE 1 [Zostera marina]